MINFLIAVALILFVAILIVHIVRMFNESNAMINSFEDEVETTTTTTTTTTTVVEDTAPAAPVVTIDDLPTLERKFKENGQPYCIDPVDGDEWMLNTNDDMYQDAKDNWWKLVGEKA